MRVLICGGRKWTDKERIRQEIYKIGRVSCIIEGNATGADQLAGEVAIEEHIELEVYPAQWANKGKAAGMIRNKQMLDEGKPDIVIAFHTDIKKSKGTANMLALAKAANIPTILVEALL